MKGIFLRLCRTAAVCASLLPFAGAHAQTTITPPPLLSQTGLFTDTVSLTPAAKMIEYNINSAFWSDGAVKRRWIYLPGGGIGGTGMVFNPQTAWAFPNGAILVKHFEMDLADGTRTRLETRALVNDNGVWSGYTYVWRQDQLDAELQGESASSVMLQTVDSNGQIIEQEYQFPARWMCTFCHTTAAGVALGLNAPQQSITNTYVVGGVTYNVNQLFAYDWANMFTTDINAPWSYQPLPNYANTAESLSRRARAYLESNCSQCHRPGGPTPVDMDFRFTTARTAMNAINVPPTQGDFGIAGAMRIAPGSKEQSMMWQRMMTLDVDRMPPVGSYRVHEEGAELIGAWIDAGAL